MVQVVIGYSVIICDDIVGITIHTTFQSLSLDILRKHQSADLFIHHPAFDYFPELLLAIITHLQYCL